MNWRGKLPVITVILAIGIYLTTIVINTIAPINYKEQKDCFLCGDSDETILSLYDDIRGIGVLGFNNFNLSTLRICNEDPDLLYTSGQQSTINANGENGSVIQIDSFVERRYAEVMISFRENSKPDLKRMARFLCENCANDIVENNKYDVGFIDYQTREIIPIKNEGRRFYVGSYVIYKVYANDEEFVCLIFYAPDQT